MCDSCHCNHHMMEQGGKEGEQGKHCHFHRHMLIRIFILLGMMFFVFWLGMQVGEFKSENGYGHMRGGYNGYRSGMMRGYDQGGYYNYQGRGMMRAVQDQGATYYAPEGTQAL